MYNAGETGFGNGDTYTLDGGSSEAFTQIMG